METEEKVISKSEGWGLPGGGVEFLNHPWSITVQNLSLEFDQVSGIPNILLVREKHVESKKKRTIDFEQYLRDLQNLIKVLLSKKSPISWEQVRQLLETAVPKTNSILDRIMKFLSGQEPDSEGLDLFRKWDPESEKTKVILTAIREELEETGHLVRPEPILEIPVSATHKKWICHTLVIAGKLKKESGEIYEVQWWPLTDLPPSRKEALSNMNILAANTMYNGHKHRTLPLALKALREKGFPFPNTAVVDAFIESQARNLAVANPAQ